MHRASPAGSSRRRSRLLMVKLADLGDAVLLSAALDAAATALPDHEVDVLVGVAGAPLYRHDPRVRRVWAFDRKLLAGRRAFTPRSLLAWGKLLWSLRRERYDAILLAHHLTTILGTLKVASLALACGAPIRVGLDNGRGDFLNLRYPDRGLGALCEGAYWVRLVGVLAGSAVRGRLGIRVDPEAEATVDGLLGVPIARPLIAIHHGTGGWIPARAWKAEGYAEVATAVYEHVGGTLLLIGGLEEREAAEEVARLAAVPTRVLAGQTGVSELAALLRRCDLYLGPDSGPMQLAAALGTPVVSLWGPTNEAAWGPCAEIGAARAVCLRPPDRPRPWVYVGHRMGDPYRESNPGSFNPADVTGAVLRSLEESGFEGNR